MLAREPQQVERIADRGERIAQLVGKDGEELVLAPVGVAQGELAPLQLGHVEDRADRPARMTRDVVERHRGDERVDHAAIVEHLVDHFVVDPLPARGALHGKLVGRYLDAVAAGSKMDRRSTVGGGFRQVVARRHAQEVARPSVAGDAPALGIVRDQYTDRQRFEQHLHLLDALPQQALDALALDQVIADLVLALSRAQCGSRGGHQRRHAHRALQHGHVAEEVDRLGDLDRHGARPRHDEKRQIRPGRLLGEKLGEAAAPALFHRFFRKQHRARAVVQFGAQRIEVREIFARDPGARQDRLSEIRVAISGRKNQDAPLTGQRRVGRRRFTPRHSFLHLHELEHR